MSAEPHNLQVEASILGRMIRFGDRAHEILSIMRVEQFYSARHQLIFQALQKVSHGGAPTLQAVAANLDATGSLEAVGGSLYLMDLLDGVVSMVGASSEVQIVADAYRRRQMLALSRWAQNEAIEAEDADALVTAAVAKISEVVNSDGTARSGFAHASSCLETVLSTEKPVESPSGLPWLDSLYTPRPGNFIVLGGFSGGGKTALACGIAANSTGNSLIASLEMSRTEILERVIPWCLDIEATRIRERRLTDDERANIRREIVARGIHITEAENIHEIEQAARALKFSRGGLSSILIDYLQLLSTPAKRGESNRAQEVAAISRHCKLMARRLDCVVYALTQLNNDASREGIPQVHHIKESGGIRQDADAIFMVYHPDPEALKTAKAALLNLRGKQRGIEEEALFSRSKLIASRRVLDLQKGRSAEESSTQLIFEGRYTRFRAAKSTEWSTK